jgi:hypothetical protein
MTRLEAAVSHPKKLYPSNLAKTRNVAVAYVPTSTYKTDANFFLSQWRQGSTRVLYSKVTGRHEYLTPRI